MGKKIETNEIIWDKMVGGRKGFINTLFTDEKVIDQKLSGRNPV
ncbi:hypothetical protein [Bacillus cereus]|nr:hypothetical protein [Bacillus cereus]EEK78009.1 hypothetical protein bcere0009_31230 [Bacillus cereus R309803]